MTPVTFSLAIIASILIVRVRPINGLLVYCASLLWYPQYLTIPIATIDFSLSRAVVLVLMAVLILRDKLHRDFRWKLIDTLMVVFVVFKLISVSQNEVPRLFLIRESGQFVDTLIIYWIVRVVIRTRDELLHFFKGLVIISVPIAVFGVYESITGHNIYAFAKIYNAWMPSEHRLLERSGFYRADFSFGQYIAYGMYFASLVPISIAVFNKKHKLISSCIVVLMIGGVLSSMSSGPYFSLMISLVILIVFPFRGYWKVLIITTIVSVTFLDIYSNRTWYEALTRFAFSSQTAYYRVELINEALHGGMDGNWLTGYGYVGLNTEYNSLGKYWGWENQDMTNIYIQILARYGLLGLIPFVIINIHYYLLLWKDYRYIKFQNDVWIIWCFFAALFGWNIAMQTVGLLAQNSNIFYIYIALCVNMHGIFQTSQLHPL